MFYISEKTDSGTYGVLDTKDNVTEYYTPSQLISFTEMGFYISGVLFDKSVGKYTFQVKEYSDKAIAKYDRCLLMLDIAKYVVSSFNLPSNITGNNLASLMMNISIEGEYYNLNITTDIYITVARYGSSNNLNGAIYCSKPERYGEDFVALIGGTKGYIEFNNFNYLKSMIHVAKNGMYYDYKNSDLQRVIEIATEIVKKYNLVDLPDDIDYFGKNSYSNYISCTGIYGDTVIFDCYDHLTGDRDMPLVKRVKPTGQKVRACVNDNLNSINITIFKRGRSVLQLSLDMNGVDLIFQEIHLGNDEPLSKQLEEYCFDKDFVQKLRASVGSLVNLFMTNDVFSCFFDSMNIDIRKYKKYREPMVTYYPNSLDMFLLNHNLGNSIITYQGCYDVIVDPIIRDLDGNEVTRVDFITFKSGVGFTNCLPEKPFTCDVSNGLVIRAKFMSKLMKRYLNVSYQFNGYDIPKYNIDLEEY